MDTDVVVDTAVVPGAVFTERTVPLRHHLGVHLLVPLTHRLIFVQVIQPNHRQRIPMIIITLLDHQLGLGHQEGFHDIFSVHAASPHRLTLNLL